jgi:iron complex outermembrane receptor protein
VAGAGNILSPWLPRLGAGCVLGMKLLLAMSHPLVASRHLSTPALCGILSALAVPGTAAEQKRGYDLPRGDAAAMLARFAEQSGRPVLFAMDKVRGVRTNAVTGEFSPTQALDLLLAGTELVAMLDRATGDIIVHRRSAGPPAAGPGKARSGKAHDPSGAFRSANDTLKSADSGAPAAGGVLPPPGRAMQPRGPFAVLAAWVALLVGPADLAEAADAQHTGIIQGRVENVSSGDYLANVRVTVEGTALETLTDATGGYRLERVPPGPRVIQAAIGGYAPQRSNVTVAAEPVVANFALVPNLPAPVSADRAVVLQAFVVESQRLMSGSSVAVNERRAAVNLKNVVAADEFGDSAEGNVAEFVKHLPGLAIDYNNADARYVSVRGLPAFGTAVTIDGNRLASAADNFSRGTEFNQVSLNNMAYIEVAKSPLPDTPADTIGGAINMVLKGAFDRSRPVFNYRLNLNTNLSRAQGDSLVTLRERATDRGGVSPTMPGGELTYIHPVSREFGFTVSLLNSNQYSPSAVYSPAWRPVSSGTSLAPADQPFLGGLLVSDRPREGYRWSAGVTLDWKLSPRDTLSLGGQWNRFETVLDYSDLQFNAIASAVRPLSWDATATVGAANAGRVTRALTTYHKFMHGQNVKLSYRHAGPVWTLAAGSSWSHSRTYVDSAEDGVIKTVSLQSPLVSVRYAGIRDSLPAQVATVTAAGAPFAFESLGGYTLQSVTEGTPQHYDATTVSAFGNATRWLRLRVPVRAKAGFDVRREERETSNPTVTSTFVGPDGLPNTADDLAARYDLVARGYSRYPMPYGLGVIERPSARRVFELRQAQPQYFTTDDAATHRSLATNSREFTETVAAGYLRTDVALLQGRLKFAGGARYEHTFDTGRGLLNDPGAIYQRDAAGRLVVDAAGRPVRRPGSALDLARFQYVERGARGERDYGNLFPSLNASHQLRERLLLRASYARTMTRPQITSVVPSTTVTDPATTAFPTITVNNPGLKPWTSDNYDVALEYYFEQPGLVSVGAFRKEISDFFGSVRVPATSALLAEYGFDDSYLGYDIATRENVGRARVSGLEFEYRQTLTGLPGWARGLAVFANATSLRVEGAARADFSGFINRTANWGVSLSRPRYTARVNWNYRGSQRQGAVTGTNVPAGTYQFNLPRLSTEVNLEVRLTPRVIFFANVRNALDLAWRSGIYSPETPEYARLSNWVEYGPQVLVGVKGSF